MWKRGPASEKKTKKKRRGRCSQSKENLYERTMATSRQKDTAVEKQKQGKGRTRNRKENEKEKKKGRLKSAHKRGGGCALRKRRE